eukprot:2297659-Pyramimonas_sp.AAC.1
MEACLVVSTATALRAVKGARDAWRLLRVALSKPLRARNGALLMRAHTFASCAVMPMTFARGGVWNMAFGLGRTCRFSRAAITQID